MPRRRTTETAGELGPWRPGRRAVLQGLSAIGLCVVLPQRRAHAEVIADVERYLNRIDTLEARFAQIAPNGALATGKVYIHRPGRLRFDYDPPSRIRLIAPGDWRLIFYDASIKQVNVIPISQTPLGILLERDISLAEDVEVIDVQRTGGEVLVSLGRRGAAEQGSVTLVFGEQPLTLRRWTIIDPQGLETQILLEDMTTGGNIDPELFRWRDPMIFGLPD